MPDALTILGGPSSVTVDVDKGTPGIPGSQFYLSYGNPNIPGNLPGVIPRRYDLCTNIDPADSEYLFLYQYNYVINPLTGLPVINPVTGEVTIAWIPGFRLIPNTVAKNVEATFVNGLASIQFQIELPPGYSSGTGGIPQNYDIQYEISTEAGTTQQKPVSAAYVITGLVVNDGLATINMSFSGIEFMSNTWIPLSGEKIIHLILTVV